MSLPEAPIPEYVQAGIVSLATLIALPVNDDRALSSRWMFVIVSPDDGSVLARLTCPTVVEFTVFETKALLNVVWLAFCPLLTLM